MAPDDFRIWIGDFARRQWKPNWMHSSLRITESEHEGMQAWAIHPDGSPRANTQTTTFVAGRLFIHVFSCPSRHILNEHALTQFVDSRLIQIWPSKLPFIAWPPKAITDRAADRLAGDIFFRLTARM